MSKPTTNAQKLKALYDNYNRLVTKHNRLCTMIRQLQEEHLSMQETIDSLEDRIASDKKRYDTLLKTVSKD